MSLKEGSFNKFCEGTGPYVSPEALKCPYTDVQISSKTDIWSFGAVMFEIVTHKKMPRDSEKYRSKSNLYNEEITNIIYFKWLI